MTDTPVTRLRELHQPIECPDCPEQHCGYCGNEDWPCDTIAALDALEDPRPRLPWRCTGCGAKADEVQWAAIDSIYYDGHTVGISEPDLCGPFRMPGDETEPLREENKQLQVSLDAATEQAEALATALDEQDAVRVTPYEVDLAVKMFNRNGGRWESESDEELVMKWEWRKRNAIELAIAALRAYREATP